jgi:hypothetical protein
MVVGIALTGVYLLPALALQDFTSMYWMWLGGLSFSANFLLTSADPNIKPIQVALAGATFGVLLPIVAATGPEGRSRQVVLLLAAVAAVWLMMLPASYLLWKVLPFLPKVQFPWRFGILLDMALAALAGVAAGQLRSFGRRAALLAVTGLIAIAAANLHLVYAGHFFQEAFAAPTTVRGIEEALSERRDSREYLPPWTSRAAPAGPQIQILAGAADVRIEQWRSREIDLRVEARRPAELLVRQYYVPLWRAVLEDGSALDVGPDAAHGLVKVAVPSGTHRVSLRLVAAPAERWGVAASLAGLAGLGLLYALSASRRLPLSPHPVGAAMAGAEYAASPHS